MPLKVTTTVKDPIKCPSPKSMTHEWVYLGDQSGGAYRCSGCGETITKPDLQELTN